MHSEEDVGFAVLRCWVIQSCTISVTAVLNCDLYCATSELDCATGNPNYLALNMQDACSDDFDMTMSYLPIFKRFAVISLKEVVVVSFVSHWILNISLWPSGRHLFRSAYACYH